MGFMSGKRALIVGLASNRSIAWGIAQAFRREGAELALTYQNDKLKPRVEKMAAELGCAVTPCETATRCTSSLTGFASPSVILFAGTRSTKRKS